MGAAKQPDFSVIVVGAGPSGLLLALLLGKQGIPVTVLEKSDHYDDQPRASFYSLPAIHEMKRAGIFDEVSARAFHATGVSWRYIDGTKIASIKSNEGPPEAKMVSLPLDELIPLIASHFEKLPGAQILMSHEVTGICQDEQEAWVDVKAPDGEKRLSATYIVGCDGGTSKIRRELFGKSFPGRTWDQQIVATNVYYPGLAKYGWDTSSTFMIHPEHFPMVAQMSNDGLLRVTYGEDGNLTREEMLARQPEKYKTFLPGKPEPHEYNIINFSPYRIHQRLAEKLRVGRFLLAADAAHLCNPFGGMGLTGGLADVGGLYDCLYGIYAGLADESILGRHYSTKRTFVSTVRHFTVGVIHEAAPVARVNRAAFPKSNVGNAVNRSSGRAPFASTMRPNLTGGALGRTAGGYTIGGGRLGGARYFSHGPAAQAQVVQNVSQAVRAFFVSGQKAQFHGVNPVTGEKRYKAVSTLQEETGRKMRDLPRATPGSHIAFSVNPTITALTPLSHVAGYSSAEPTNLNTQGLLDVLSVDFSRSLKELAMVLNDLKRVSELGDLPITYQDSCLRIHFPGCAADTVERLCEELGIQRGIVVQDEDFDAFTGTEMALLYPFAPSSSPSEVSDLFDAVPAKQTVEIDWRNMLSPSEKSVRSSVSELDLEEEDNPWASDYDHSSPSGHESLHYQSSDSAKHDPLEYQGFEGIYRFIEQCDAARR